MRDFDHGDNTDHDEYFCFTGRARLSRDMHILEGYIQGIAADSKIKDAELKALITWLSAHKEFADRHPFNEIIPRIQRIVAEGIVDEEARADLLWLSNKFKTEDDYYDDVTSDMQRLQGILAGILSDGLITEKELRTLGTWIEERTHLKRCWPYNQLEGIIALVMRDGHIDAQEHEALIQFFGEFVSDGTRKSVGALEPGITVSGVCSMSPAIEFAQRCFCFTGTSERGSKEELASTVIQLGGNFHKNLRNDTDFLIVGADGNPCWAYACYGRKVEEAVDRRRRGQCITIVHEFDFWTAVDGAPSSPHHVDEVQVNRRAIRDRTVDRPSKPSQRSNTIRVTTPTTAGSTLAGKTIVVTGTLQKYKRDEIEALIVQHGGHAASSVSKKTDYLIAGEKAGSKLDKARSLGVRIISEAEFDSLIGAPV
jgi:NAD-dependent DNA ligase